MATENDQGTRQTHKAGAFDVRVFVGGLLGLYGIILVLEGIFANSHADKAKTGNVNIDLWVGIGLLVATAVFVTWARLRPVVVPEDSEAPLD